MSPHRPHAPCPLRPAAPGNRLRALGDRVSAPGSSSDVAIDMVQKADGSIIVLPATATA